MNDWKLVGTSWSLSASASNNVKLVYGIEIIQQSEHQSIGIDRKYRKYCIYIFVACFVIKQQIITGTAIKQWLHRNLMMIMLLLSLFVCFFLIVHYWSRSMGNLILYRLYCFTEVHGVDNGILRFTISNIFHRSL